MVTTRNGYDVAVIISPEDLAQLEETLSVLSDPEALPLRGDLAGVWSARRGTYRVLYRLRDDPHEAIVLRIEHRRGAYRPL